jgi:hypothetical protein
MNCKYQAKKLFGERADQLPLIPAIRNNGSVSQIEKADAILEQSYSDIYNAEQINELYQNASWSDRMLLYQLALGLNRKSFLRIPDSQISTFYTSRLKRAYTFFRSTNFFASHDDHQPTLQARPLEAKKTGTNRPGISVSCRGEIAGDEHDEIVKTLMDQGYVPLDPYENRALFNQLYSKVHPYLSAETDPDTAQKLKEERGIFYKAKGNPRIVLLTPKNIKRARAGERFSVKMSALFEEEVG